MNIEKTKINNIQEASNSSVQTKTQENNSSTNFQDELKSLNSQTKETKNEEVIQNKNLEKEGGEKHSQEDIKPLLNKEIPIENALADLNSVVNKFNNNEQINNNSQFNQSDEKISDLIKDNENIADRNDMINRDFNIQENKDLLPQMSPNMNFSGDGQPFSSFMNNEEQKQQKNPFGELKYNEKDLEEERAILSTMAENIAIANKNQILKEVEKEDGIKKVNVKTGITQETIVKFDSIVMNQTDVEVFADIVNKDITNLAQLSEKNIEKSLQISKTLADILAKAKDTNQPVRIDFDNNISVIIKISRDGKISADFLPSTQVAEAYLKENLPLLKQRFDDNNIKYDELNQRERRDQQRENNKKKGRNNE